MAGKRARISERKLLAELLKDSKKSDREIAKVLGVSQPTVSRTRDKVRKEGLIREYTIVPDFAELGYQIMAVTVARAKATLSPTEQEKAKELVLENPRVIFVATAEGMGKNGIMISLHKNYSDFRNFMTDLRFNSEGFMEDVDTILVSLKPSMLVKPLSLAYLARDIAV